jgi:hypothetical protein
MQDQSLWAAVSVNDEVHLKAVSRLADQLIEKVGPCAPAVAQIDEALILARGGRFCLDRFDPLGEVVDEVDGGIFQRTVNVVIEDAVASVLLEKDQSPIFSGSDESSGG